MKRTSRGDNPAAAPRRFGMFCNLPFASKNLAIAETGKSATFSEYAEEFFLLWFYPIGIRFIEAAQAIGSG